MSELEGSGSRNPAVVRSERRAARAFRQQSSRIDAMEDGAPLGRDLTTTPQNIRHNLKGDGLTAEQVAARVGAAYLVPVEWSGAYVVRRETAGLGNLITTSTPNDKVFIGLSLESGAGRVSVVIF